MTARVQSQKEKIILVVILKGLDLLTVGRNVTLTLTSWLLHRQAVFSHH
jgi:hypothetical protein